MKQLLTKALAFCLSIIMFLGSVTPAYAAQTDNTENHALRTGDVTTLSSPTLSSPSMDEDEPTMSSPSIGEDEDITEEDLPTIEWDYDGWVTITAPEEFATIVGWLENEDGEVCSSEWIKQSDYYYGSLEYYVKEMWEEDTCSGTYYLAVCAQNDQEERTKKVVCDVPIYFTNETVSGNAVIEKGTSLENYYFKDFPGTEYDELVITLSYVDDMGETQKSDWSCEASGGYYCISEDTAKEWQEAGYSLAGLVGYETSYTTADVSVKFKRATKFSESPFANPDAFQELQLSAPNLSMDDEMILVENTEKDLNVNVYGGLVPKEAYESGSYDLASAIHLISVDAADQSYVDLAQYLSYMQQSSYMDSVEPGIYYYVAYAQVYRGPMDSVYTVLKTSDGNPYPIIVNKSESEESVEYQFGQYRENIAYFNGYTSETYPWVNLVVDFETDNDYDGAIDSSETEVKELYTMGGTYYFNKEAYDNQLKWDERYKSWTLKHILLNQLDISSEKCIWNVTTASVSESAIPYPEEKVTEPKIFIEQNESGKYNICIKNTWNKCVDLYFGLRSETDIVSETVVYLAAGETTYRTIEEVFTSDSIDAGTYSLYAYAEGWSNEINSEIVVLEDYPIVVADQDLDDEVAYKRIEESNEIYFADVPEGDYDLVKLHWTEIGGEYDEGPRSERLCKRLEYYYLPYYYMYSEEYSLDKLELSQFEIGEEECEVTRKVITSFVQDEELKEPKPEAPSLELYRENGKVVGVVVTNNNQTFDDEEDWVSFRYIGEDANGEEFVGEECWGEHLESGQEKIVRFENMSVPIDLTDGTNWELGCYVSSYDFMNEESILSDYTYLDYGIECRKEVYSGDGIHVFEEHVSQTDDEGYEEEYVSIHVPIEELPKNPIASVVYYQSEYYDNEYTLYLYENYEPEGFVTGDIWYEDISIIENITKARFLTSAEYGDSKLVITYTEVPKEKIIAEDVTDNQKPVILLDYDYYKAFVASGGEVTYEDGKLLISDSVFKSEFKGKEWLLKSFKQLFKGFEIFQNIEEIGRDVLKDANYYWKGFVAKHFYDVDGKEIPKDRVEDHDIVLVKYEPEVVWIESIKLSAPGHVKVGETVTVGATPVYPNTGYKRDVPAQFRFKVSDPSIAKIDPVTGKLTGLKNGTVTVTVIADEALREQHRSLERVLTSVKVTVGHVHYEKYTKTTVKAPTCTKSGSEKWICKDCPDKMTKTVTLKKLGHDVSAKVTTKATATSNGKITETCKRCKKVVDTDAIYKISSVKLSKTSYTYDGTVKKPTVTVKDSKGKVLKLNTDYTVSYAKGRKNVGSYKVTVKFKGKYSGSETEIFKIKAKKITSSMISDVSAKTYTGKAQKPSVKVKYGDVTLKNKSNYTVSYKNNTNAGTASVTVTGKGNYTGSATVKFTIKPKSIEGFKLSKVGTQTYTGKNLKPSVTVKNGSKKLVSGTDYKVSYSKNKNTGTATVKVTGKGNYSGTLKTTFVIKPKQAALKTLKTTAKGSMTVKWAKDTQATGYIVEYSTSKKFLSSKTTKLVIEKNTDVSEKITGLKSKKTYYVRVTSYKTIGEKNYNGKASAVKSVKVK